ncbi:DNA-formamidopyrimidine glycosylase [bacterium]|nr:DNA-formamidopyrimidine glycosylase [bacterium]
MPELPEVETIVRQLLKRCHILNNPITAVSWERPNRWVGIDPEAAVARLVSRRVLRIRRRGKYILFDLDDGQTLIIHLRMTGKLLYQPAGISPDPHTREAFHFADGSTLQFNDPRTLGRIYLLAPGETIAPLQKMGPEPFSAEFSFEHIRLAMIKSRLEIKDFLLNQTKIAGIGNIYASEILFTCGIHPQRVTASLSDNEVAAIVKTVPDILQQAIDLNGTTFLDYRTAENKTGEFQKMLKVYGKTAEPCKNCGTAIERIVQKQRSSFFCPQCQPPIASTG